MAKNSRLISAFIVCFIFFSGGLRAASTLLYVDLPKGALSDSLIVFAKQSDVSFLVSEELVSPFENAPLKGYFTVSQALSRLLSDTNLGYQILNSNTVSISPRFLKEEGALPPKALPEAIVNDPIQTIEEVTVTTEYRLNNMQKVPLAVSVLSDTVLAINDISNLTSIASRSPGLTVTSYSLGQPSIHMRGVGSNDDGAAMDNSVAVFLDDVYIGRLTTLDLNVLDLERVEVLRGPQGTLYGKNAIGGALRLISKWPTEEAELKLQLQAGNYQSKGFNIVASGAVTETLKARFALDAKRRNGWQKNIVLNGDRQHAQAAWGLRQKLSLTPSDMFELRWGLDFSRENFNSSGRIPVSSRTPIRVLDSAGNRVPLRDNQGNTLFDSSGSPLYETRLPTTLFQELGGDYRNATNSEDGFTDRKIWGFHQRASIDSSWGQWVSISAYRDSLFEWLEDSTGLSSAVSDQLIGSGVNESHRQFSQEFRLTSTATDNFSYLLGLYYLYEHTNRFEAFPFVNVTPFTRQDNRTNSIAVFGQLSYQWNSKTQVTAGGRFNKDSKDLDQSSRNNGAPSVILEDFDLRSSRQWQDFSPRFSLSYEIDEDRMLYGSIARGMKSGGFQGAPGTLDIAKRTIAPEYAWAYEMAYKSQWLDDRLRVNITGFYSRYEDLQVVQFQTIDNFGLFQTNNAASAKLRGAEFEFDTSFFKGFLISGSYSFLRATYEDYNDPENRDFTGNTLRQAPKHTVNVSLRYRHALNRGAIRLHTDYRYQSKSFREPDNSQTIQPSFKLIDLSVSYISQSEQWELSLWSKNILDEEYVSHLFVLGGNDYAIYGTPKTFGLRLNWHLI